MPCTSAPPPWWAAAVPGAVCSRACPGSIATVADGAPVGRPRGIVRLANLERVRLQGRASGLNLGRRRIPEKGRILAPGRPEHAVPRCRVWCMERLVRVGEPPPRIDDMGRRQIGSNEATEGLPLS